MDLKYTQKIFLLLLVLHTIFSNAQPPSIQWQKSLGGPGGDHAQSIIQTLDGGYIVAGLCSSNGGNVTGNHGSSDYWIVKLSTTGIIQWQKSLGGTSVDGANSICQTTDGGYIVAGYSNSNNGNVTGNHGSQDYWIVKLSSTGIIQWQKSLGGTSNEEANSIYQTTDGGYIVAGYSFSSDGDVTGNHGSRDYWIVKLTSTGIIQWQKSLGGTGSDIALSIKQTLDGGYIIAGLSTTFNNGDVTSSHGSGDYWIVKLTSTGVIQWQKSLGGTSNDEAYSVIQTTDGGYIVAGHSYSNNGDVTGTHEGGDYWIVKLTSAGVIQWQKSFGGTRFDEAYSIIQTTDGGYVVIGNSESNDGDVTGNHEGGDYWIVKLSSTGVILWQKSLGGSEWEYAYDVIQSIDGGFVVAGYSNSTDGDVTGNTGADYWIVKLSPDNLSSTTFADTNTFTIFPNPTKENLTIKLDYFIHYQEITITDILGKTIHYQKLNGLITTINTNNFKKGIYFLNLIEGSIKTIKKFIKE